MVISLIQAGRKGGSAHRHYWTDDEKDIVRRDYDGKNRTAQLLAIKLSHMTGGLITFNAVKGQVQKMGLAIDKSPRWSEREVEALTEMITQYSPITIAKRLNRSVNSVVIKSKRLRLSRRVRDGWFTKKEVCEILGVDHKKIQRYIDSGELKASWHSERKPQKNGMTMWSIKTEDLKVFIRKNIGDFQGRNADLVMIVWILNGDI